MGGSEPIVRTPVQTSGFVSLNRLTKRHMRESVPNFEQYVTEDQVEFVTYAGWYLSNGYFDSRRVIQRWIDRLEQVLDKGYARGQPPAPRLRGARPRR